jgi:hypothetical protein
MGLAERGAAKDGAALGSGGDAGAAIGGDA